MLQLVLVLFVCISVARGGGGLRYGDYSAAGMPHYNMEYESRVAAPMDEYLDRSPDAPAHLDYKYEEEPQDTVKSFPVKNIDDEIWQKPNAKERRPKKKTDLDESEVEARDAMVPKNKSSRRFTKHRTRIKGDRIARPSGRRINYDRSPNDDVISDDRNDFDLRKEPSRKGKGSDNFELRDTSHKAPRRKPRDRNIRPEKEVRFERDNDEEINRARETESESEEMEIRKGNRYFNKKERVRPALAEIEKTEPKTYQEYEAYEDIDMKRVNKLKNRLPDFFRRTQASDPEPTRTSSMQQDLSYRRVNPLEVKSTSEGSTKSPIAQSTSAINIIGIVTNQSTAITSKSILLSTPKNSSALSIAEKSRLSIMKKAQKKERARNTTTTKPPVLLQVTQRMQTVVMVEPHQPDMQFRARKIFDDSPERIQRAKKLMRHKLLAGAKSIHDLADNWDEMVCDYIDVSLLDSRAAYCYCTSYIILLSVIFNFVMAFDC